MGLKSKTTKGGISVTNNNGRIRLRWRYQGERYALGMSLSYSAENLAVAAIKAAEIKLDILKDRFDITLKKYRVGQATDIDVPVQAEVIPCPGILKKAATSDSCNWIFLSDLIEEFSYWAKHIKNVDIDTAVDYLYVRKWIKKCKNVLLNNVAERLSSEAWATTTYNKRLSYLNNFLSWMHQGGKITVNPLAGVSRKKNKGKKKMPKRVPLSEEEISKLLNAIRDNTFCPNASKFKHSHYHPFLCFMFLTGARNAEAIGLRVKHVDFKANRIEISETFARTAAWWM